MTQHAIVKRLSGQDVAEISLLRQVECSMHCDSCGGCLKPPAGEELLALAKNPIGAKPGDRVEVETTTGNSIGMALLVFGFPCLALVLGYLAEAGCIGAKWPPSVWGRLPWWSALWYCGA